MLVGVVTVLQAQQADKVSLPVETTDQLLHRHGVGLSREDLIAALRNPDAEVRISASFKLAENRDKGAIPFIWDALSAETATTNKISLALSLAQLGDSRGADLLKSFCSDQKLDGSLRISAARDLLLLGNDSCLNPILSILRTSSDSGAVTGSMNLLPQYFAGSKNVPKEVLDLLCKRLADESTMVRSNASNILALLGSKAQAPALEDAIAKEPEKAVRDQMEEALAKLKNKESK